MWPHRRQPTRLPHPWDSPGKNTAVGCHFLLQCMKVKKSEAAQSCPTRSDPRDCSLRGCSVHGILQAGALECAPSPSSSENPWPAFYVVGVCVNGSLGDAQPHATLSASLRLTWELRCAKPRSMERNLCFYFILFLYISQCLSWQLTHSGWRGKAQLPRLAQGQLPQTFFFPALLWHLCQNGSR